MRAVVGSEVVRRSNGDLYGGQSDGKKKGEGGKLCGT